MGYGSRRCVSTNKSSVKSASLATCNSNGFRSTRWRCITIRPPQSLCGGAMLTSTIRVRFMLESGNIVTIYFDPTIEPGALITSSRISTPFFIQKESSTSGKPGTKQRLVSLHDYALQQTHFDLECTLSWNLAPGLRRRLPCMPGRSWPSFCPDAPDDQRSTF